MALPYSNCISGRRSPFDLVKDVVHSGRMLDKFRLSCAGQAFMKGRSWRDASTQRLNEPLAKLAEGHALAAKQAVALALEAP